jgi:DNA polymerase/3'-5' exonuclease PolX
MARRIPSISVATGISYNAADIWPVAQSLAEALRPACVRLEIAGSLRRQKALVHDIEIVAMPRLERDLFGDLVVPRDGLTVDAPTELDEVLARLVRQDRLCLGDRMGSRYKKFWVSAPDRPRIKLDLFIVLPPAQWGVLFAIRTGPADFSHWIVTQRLAGGALPSHCRVLDGAVREGLIGEGKIIPMPEENDFLEFLGLGWIEPAERIAQWPQSLQVT